MKKRITIGLLIGIAAGIVDVIPMLLQKLTWDANLSAFSMWMVIGFMVATSRLQLPAALKGILIAFVCVVPVLFLVGWKDPVSLLPICGMTLILGALVGLTFRWLVKEQ